MSSSPSGSGQLSPAIRARLRQAFTAPALNRTLAPIARWLSPCANLSRKISRIFRIDNLSPGILSSCCSAKEQATYG
jgi:hypothetical protein